MAKQVKLAAQNRSVTGRSAVKKIKNEGFVPAVIYSRAEGAAHLQVVEREIASLLNHAAGEHVLIDLDIAGSGSRLAIIQEVQHHPVTQRILHVDFHGVSANEEIEASIPVEPVGESVGVKSYGGLLEQLVREVTLKALPQNLPQLVQVDVTALAVGGSIHIKDLVLPEGVIATGDGDIAIFLVAEPKVAAEAPNAAGGDKKAEAKK